MKKIILYLFIALSSAASAQILDHHSQTPSDASILKSIGQSIHQNEGIPGYYEAYAGKKFFLGIVGKASFFHDGDSLSYVLLSENSDGNGYLQKIIRKHLILKKKGKKWILLDSLTDHSAYGEGKPQFIHVYDDLLMIESERAYTSEGGEDFEFRDFLIVDEDGFLQDAQLSVMTYYDHFSSASCMDDAGEYLQNCDCNSRYSDIWPYWKEEEKILFFMVDGEVLHQYGDACNDSGEYIEKTIYGFSEGQIIEVWHSRVPDFEGEIKAPDDEELIRIYRQKADEAAGQN